MNGFSIALRICFLIAMAAILGWYYGSPALAVIITLTCVLGFWAYQLSRVQDWLQDPEQKPPDIYGMWGDLLAQIYLHQRKNKEARLRLQSTVSYLQDSFASMRDGVVMVDQHGAIKWCNAAVESLLGLRYPEDTGQTLTNLVREPEFNEYFLGDQYAQPLEYCIVGDAKRHLQVQITYFGASERLLFVRDFTALVRMEQIRRDFVGNVSHELRTPLTVITGYLGTFLSDTAALPTAYIRALEQMEQQAQRMESLLKDLLWLSRIESEQREDNLDLVNISALLQELRDETATNEPERTIELVLASDHQVSGNYRELHSAVSNLLNNAIKYSSAEDVIKIRWEQRDQQYFLTVQDYGPGIDLIHLPRLTERFYRVDDSRSSATGGTGLGLAIVKHVAAAHGAKLLIESELGKGSSFTLIFPVGE
ncbi:MAG: phosphate regulon sensor histidine kinase PhoR [Halioglobus sp.]